MPKETYSFALFKLVVVVMVCVCVWGVRTPSPHFDPRMIVDTCSFVLF